MIIVTQQFAGYLADAIDRRRAHQRVLGSLVFRRRRAERTDRTGRKQRAIVLPGNLERVHQRTDIDLPRLLRDLFARGAEQCDQVKNRIDLVLADNPGIRFRIEGVEQFERSRLAQCFTFTHIGRHDVGIPVNAPQISGQLRSDLAASPNDQYLFHNFRL